MRPSRDNVRNEGRNSDVVRPSRDNNRNSDTRRSSRDNINFTGNDFQRPSRDNFRDISPNNDNERYSRDNFRDTDLTDHHSDREVQGPETRQRSSRDREIQCPETRQRSSRDREVQGPEPRQRSSRDREVQGPEPRQRSSRENNYDEVTSDLDQPKSYRYHEKHSSSRGRHQDTLNSSRDLDYPRSSRDNDRPRSRKRDKSKTSTYEDLPLRKATRIPSELNNRVGAISEITEELSEINLECGCGKGCACTKDQCKCKKPERCSCTLRTECTRCNPKGDMCRNLTISDLYTIWRSDNVSDATKQVAKEFLSQIKCLPSLVGRHFWNAFQPVPTIAGIDSYTDICNCEKNSKDCKCINTLIECNDEHVYLKEFNFRMNDIYLVNDVIILWPFGNCVVPSPLKICKYATFTIRAYKRISRDDSEESNDEEDNCKKITYTAKKVINIKRTGKHISKSFADFSKSFLRSENKCSFSAEESKLISDALTILEEDNRSDNDSEVVAFGGSEQKNLTVKSDQDSASESSDSSIISRNEDKKRDSRNENPFSTFYCKGVWKCETVTCRSECADSKCVKYYIVLQENSLKHYDGGKLTEGWSFFTNQLFTHYSFEMDPQVLALEQPLEKNEACNC